ncbi:MAG: hypothetical protein U0822_23160 [Anaerolineae bacterium]
MKNISVIGTGYVGLVTGTCLADLGNNVTCVDIDPNKIEMLRNGIMPIYEPGVEELVRRNVASGRLSFTTSYEESVPGSDFVFICVDTPSGAGGEADLKYVRSAAVGIAQVMRKPLIVINRSTVPIGAATSSTTSYAVTSRATSPSPSSPTRSSRAKARRSGTAASPDPSSSAPPTATPPSWWRSSTCPSAPRS